MENLLQEKFYRLLNELSPENLCCDGEISKSQVKVKYRRLMNEWRELEKEAGYKVSIDQMEQQQINEYINNRK